MDLLREIHKHRDALVEPHELPEASNEAAHLLSGAAAAAAVDADDADQRYPSDADDDHLGELLLHPHRESLETTQSQRQAQMELYDYAQRRMARRLIVDVRGLEDLTNFDEGNDDDGIDNSDMDDFDSSDACIVDDHDVSEACNERLLPPLASPGGSHFRTDHVASSPPRHQPVPPTTYGSLDGDDRDHCDRDAPHHRMSAPRKPGRTRRCDWLRMGLHQLPAIAVVTLLWLMMALPFGVAYFPVGWSSSFDDADAYEQSARNYSATITDDGGFTGRSRSPARRRWGSECASLRPSWDSSS
jgi:hypothetical protein